MKKFTYFLGLDNPTKNLLIKETNKLNIEK